MLFVFVFCFHNLIDDEIIFLFIANQRESGFI